MVLATTFSSLSTQEISRCDRRRKMDSRSCGGFVQAGEKKNDNGSPPRQGRFQADQETVEKTLHPAQDLEADAAG
jgi:hypothetical protein